MRVNLILWTYDEFWLVYLTDGHSPFVVGLAFLLVVAVMVVVVVLMLLLALASVLLIVVVMMCSAAVATPAVVLLLLFLLLLKWWWWWPSSSCWFLSHIHANCYLYLQYYKTRFDSLTPMNSAYIRCYSTQSIAKLHRRLQMEFCGVRLYTHTLE